MLDYNNELKKFKTIKSVEIEDTDIFEDNVKDITELIEELVKQKNGDNN